MPLAVSFSLIAESTLSRARRSSIRRSGAIHHRARDGTSCKFHQQHVRSRVIQNLIHTVQLHIKLGLHSHSKYWGWFVTQKANTPTIFLSGYRSHILTVEFLCDRIQHPLFCFRNISATFGNATALS